MSFPSVRVPLVIKIFVVCTGLAVVVPLVGSLAVYRGASQSLREEVRQRLIGTARTAALQISPELHERIKTRSDESSEAYRTIKRTLIRIKQANPNIRFVYTVRKTADKNELQFVVDAEEDPLLVSHIGDRYNTSKCPQMKKGFAYPSADDEPIVDKWGTWLSGYAPIKDREGRAIGAIGMDMSVDELNREESLLRKMALHSILLASLLGMLLSLIVTRAALRLVCTFTRAADRVTSGDLDFRLDIKRTDEVGQFAEAFNHMLLGLRQTTRDFLTGLYNHRSFQESLGSELEMTKQFGHHLCLMIIDVDGFKSINDSMGHPVGDSILRQLATVLRQNSRRLDVIARYGGDEFAIMLPESDLASGVETAERLRLAIESNKFYALRQEEMLDPEWKPDDAKSITVTITAGISVFPDHHSTRDGLVMSADIALCRAKNISKNSVCAYDPSICSDRQVDPQDIYQMLRDPNSAAIESLSAAVEARDRYTCGHSERVTQYALILGEALGMDQQALDGLKVAGLLHDLGKIGVPDALLNKASDLTFEERQAVQLHPSIAESILRRTPQFDWVIPAVLCHHERWDGKGYPNKLAAEDIPLDARILAIADSFDAMTSDRPYRHALSMEHALQELIAGAGKQFDPRLVNVFVACISREFKDQAA